MHGSKVYHTDICHPPPSQFPHKEAVVRRPEPWQATVWPRPRQDLKQGRQTLNAQGGPRRPLANPIYTSLDRKNDSCSQPAASPWARLSLLQAPPVRSSLLPYAICRQGAHRFHIDVAPSRLTEAYRSGRRLLRNQRDYSTGSACVTVP